MLITLATALGGLAVVVASSSSDPSLGDSILYIPLARRDDTKADGPGVDVDRLQYMLLEEEAKIQRGFEAYKRNTGIAHPLLARQGPKNETLRLLNAPSSGKLTGVQQTLWYGQISVGTPAKTYTVDFDTGSSDLFLPGPQCTSNCDQHQKYDPSKSQTSSDVAKSFQLRYGDGSTVSGRQYTDTVAFGDLSGARQRLGAAATYSTGFAKSQFPPDGLMGMGFPSISNYRALPVFHTFVQQRQTQDPVFAFKLAKQGGELRMGGVNRDLYKGPVTYAGVTTKAYWQVRMDGVVVGDRVAVGSTSAIIDTGTSLILGDVDNVAAVYQMIPDARDEGNGFYSVPCGRVPTIRLAFGGVAFQVSAETFNFRRVSSGSSRCIGAIVASSASTDFWIVGDAFLQNVYTIFDVGQSRVGFAELS